MIPISAFGSGWGVYLYIRRSAYHRDTCHAYHLISSLQSILLLSRSVGDTHSTTTNFTQIRSCIFSAKMHFFRDRLLHFPWHSAAQPKCRLETLLSVVEMLKSNFLDNRLPKRKNRFLFDYRFSHCTIPPVSYTHLTLPTILRV